MMTVRFFVLVITSLYLLDIFNIGLPVRAQIFRSDCRKDGLFKLVARNAKLEGSQILLMATSLVSLSQCAKLCVDELFCMSLNYNPITTDCEILAESRSPLGNKTLSSIPDWKHYEPVTNRMSPVCRVKTHSSCKIAEKCVDTYENREGFKCQALQNIALGKPATQAIDYPSRPASRAVDGNTATWWGSNSCTHAHYSSPNFKPWWRVDFGNTAIVYSVSLTNRGDCCGQRLSNFNIRVGESTSGRGDENSACGMNLGVGGGQTKGFYCVPALYGRYLYVQSNLLQVLTICETQVFGEFV